MEQELNNTTSPSAEGRISVLRDGRIVPLLPHVHPHAQEAAKKQPWSGILLERHQVKPSEVPTHEHMDLCLHLQVSGEAGFAWWSGQKNDVVRSRPGSMILIAPGTSDRLVWQGTTERLIVSIQPAWLGDYAEKLGAKAPVDFETRWDFRDASVEYLVAEMGREAAQGWPLGHLYADLLAMSAGSLLLRRHAVEAIAAPGARGGLSLSQLRHAMEFMHEHLAQDVRLEQIAEVLNLSAFHFAHQFRNSTGQTPYQYLLDQRMDYAKDLLQSTEFSVQAIGALTGFRSPTNFVRAFRERVGATPGEWRKSA